MRSPRPNRQPMRRARTWKEPGAIAATKGLFEIDKVIRSLKLQPGWRSIDEATDFGRRALQVAVDDAARYEGRRAAEQFGYFARAAELAERARSALQRLITHIGPSGLKPRVLSETRVESPLRHEVNFLRFLVALLPVHDLLLCAKHLLVATSTVWHGLHRRARGRAPLRAPDL